MRRSDTKTPDPLLVLQIASGATGPEAAAACGVSLATVNRRLKDLAFQQAVQEVRAGYTSSAAGKLGSLYLDNVDVIRRLAVDATAPHMVRLLAARAVVDLGVKLRAEADLERRIRVLEERAGAQTT